MQQHGYRAGDGEAPGLFAIAMNVQGMQASNLAAPLPGATAADEDTGPRPKRLRKNGTRAILSSGDEVSSQSDSEQDD